MDADRFIAHLDREGRLLADAAAGVDWSAPVPGLASTLRETLVHVGAVHRWCADIVRRGLARNETGGSAAFLPDLPDDRILDWYAGGLTALVATLDGAPADLEVWAFGRSRPAQAFWSRRQAHETAVHRADVEAAAGRAVTPFVPAFAQDGLAEIVGGFARGFPGGTPARLALVATDGDDWLVTFGGERIVAAPSADLSDVDTRVRGSSSDLYRWAWNRPTPVEIDGDREVAARWQEVRIT